MFWFTRGPIQIRTPDLGLGFSTFARGLSSAGCGKGCMVQTHSFNHHSLQEGSLQQRKGLSENRVSQNPGLHHLITIFRITWL